ncbi:MAG: hypothetical protein ABI574_16275 [Burkholderiales bacterium]
MFIFRTLVLLLLVAAALCFAMYLATKDRRWSQRAALVVKWTVIAGLAFFAVMLLERVAMVV